MSAYTRFLTMASLLAGLSGHRVSDPDISEVPERVLRHFEPKVPKGLKEYFFNDRGVFSTEGMRKDECVFKCVALNDKSALRKYNNWKAVS